MSYIARRSHHRGGNRNPQDFQRRKNAALIIGHGDIFSSESPKAYSPLGYSLPDQPTVLKPEDFNNDTPLPACPQRPPFYVTKPLGATFVDTESEKPNFMGTHREVPSRDNSNSTPADPAIKIVNTHSQQKAELTLGKNVISETGLENGTVYLEKILKRERETTTEPEDNKEVKKQKKDLMGEGEVNEDTVRPENVLRMVDSSLVDTPEKKTPDEQHPQYYESPKRGDSHEDTADAPYSQSSRTRPIGSERRYDYERNSSSGSFRDDYMIYDDYRPSQAPPIPYYNKRERRESNGSSNASAPSSRYPPSGSGYYEDYPDYRYSRGAGSSSGNNSYYDDRYEDKRHYGGNGRYGGNVPPIGEPARSRKNSRDYDYEDYRRRNNPSSSGNGRRYDDRRRY
ncbi:hypothetical protein TRVA0_043S00518 [Trichomonascus vanleenenianus]|uniref:uncharacterized protein n=1 Tax=Trichomonascus vanleenenianus TaxID=2268995 RepID=UPI003ECA832E